MKLILRPIRLDYISIIFLLLSFLFLFASTSSCSRAKKSNIADNRLIAELEKLDSMADNSSTYDLYKRNKIRKIKEQISNSANNENLKLLKLYQRLGEAYKSFSSDSSVIYYGRAAAKAKLLRNDSLLLINKLGRINALASAGIFATAQAELKAIDTTDLSLDMKTKTALAGRQLYSYMTSFVEGHEDVAPEVQKRLTNYTDYLISNMNKADEFRQFIEYERHIKRGKYNETKGKLENMLKKLPQESNLYGMAAFQLALIYLHQGDEQGYAKALAQSAESDIQGSIKEGMALPTLALWLYKNGDTKRAYKYINLSMQDAQSGNARMRTGMISKAITLIDAAYQDKIETSREWITASLIIAIVLLIIAIWIMTVSHKRKKKIIEVRNRLSQFTKVQDTYIGHFIGLCVLYSDKLNSLSKLVSRKISSGQTDELLKLIKSDKFTDEQTEDFYRHFDHVFLDLYPNFVPSINKLLREDSRIEQKEKDVLTAELRIYAFVRLGVDESIKISKILHYSPATIYTYRNKMRNRAINRDTFDEDVMKISTFS